MRPRELSVPDQTEIGLRSQDTVFVL